MWSSFSRFTRFAWIALGYNLLVILWGAWVRISGSGAGCGSHWPTCNGEVIPHSPTVETLIEYSHRLTSGISLILGIILLVWAYRAHPQTKRIRVAAWGTLIFLLLEALLGAGIVLLGLVDTNSSWLRAAFISLHLVNTFGLIGFGTLTAWWADGHEGLRFQSKETLWLFFALFAVLITCIFGAITALGDTLFQVNPEDARSVLVRIREDLAPQNHFLVRLRILHPIIAVLASAYLWIFCSRWRQGEIDHGPRAKFFASQVASLVFIQVLVGFFNILWSAPPWIQILHLLLANFLWIALILLLASVLENKPASFAIDSNRQER